MSGQRRNKVKEVRSFWSWPTVSTDQNRVGTDHSEGGADAQQLDVDDLSDSGNNLQDTWNDVEQNAGTQTDGIQTNAAEPIRQLDLGEWLLQRHEILDVMVRTKSICGVKCSLQSLTVAVQLLKPVKRFSIYDRDIAERNQHRNNDEWGSTSSKVPFTNDILQEG